MTITLHQGDLPDGLSFGASVAVDTETLGLNPLRDRLCLVQLSAGDGSAHLVQVPKQGIAAPNLCRLFADRAVQKIFHFGRFDMAMLDHALGVMPEPVFCTKIASKLTRTYTDRHSLKELARELIGIDLSKQQQSSDWGAPELSQAQLEYAAADVQHLHALRDRLTEMLKREGRLQLAQACFAFLPTRVRLDLAGFTDDDLFAH
ncbi:MAG: ribonuclease D [Hyphomicrobiales bacterium]|nr:ribonuclease D [Hyphomicrobiales bacterium]